VFICLFVGPLGRKERSNWKEEGTHAKRKDKDSGKPHFLLGDRRERERRRFSTMTLGELSLLWPDSLLLRSPPFLSRAGLQGLQWLLKRKLEGHQFLVDLDRTAHKDDDFVGDVYNGTLALQGPQRRASSPHEVGWV